MEEIAVALKRFGDEQSALLDQFERLSFEVRLNQAIFGRSLSEPSTVRPHLQAREDVRPPEGVRRRPGFRKVLKKLLRPFIGRRSNGKVDKGDVADYSRSIPIPNPNLIANPNPNLIPNFNPNPVPVYSKAFSRSLRV